MRGSNLQSPSQEQNYLNLAQASSEELVRDRYAVQAIPIVDTKGLIVLVLRYQGARKISYNLKLNGHKPKVNDLHSWPNYVVRL